MHLIKFIFINEILFKTGVEDDERKFYLKKEYGTILYRTESPSCKGFSNLPREREAKARDVLMSFKLNYTSQCTKTVSTDALLFEFKF